MMDLMMDSLGNPGEWLLSENVSGLDAGIGESRIANHKKSHDFFLYRKLWSHRRLPSLRRSYHKSKSSKGSHLIYIINFETKEDFIEYLDKHREELNQLSTCKLNKLCKIKGYHITKLNGEISLRSARKSETIESKSKAERILNEIEDLKTMVKKLHINYQTLLGKLSEAGIIVIESDEEAW